MNPTPPMQAGPTHPTDAASRDAVRPGQRALSFAFRLYKSFFSPVVHALAPSRCLYLPTCSEYAYTAIARFGVLRGSRLALNRIRRCHPWGKGGLDPVPDLPAHPVCTHEVHAHTHSSASANSLPFPASGQTGANHLP
jgi:uncharacterized protein